MDKNSLRKLALKKRMTVVDKQAKDKRIREYLLPFIQDKTHIGIYLSKEEEVDTYSIIRLFPDKQFYSSKIEEGNLQFYLLDLNSLVLAGFGLLEPSSKKRISASNIDIMIVPLVAFDHHKNRIGFGKGYYDRYLSQYKNMKIGIAYAEQQVDAILAEEHDVQLDYIITDQGII